MMTRVDKMTFRFGVEKNVVFIPNDFFDLVTSNGEHGWNSA